MLDKRVLPRLSSNVRESQLSLYEILRKQHVILTCAYSVILWSLTLCEECQSTVFNRYNTIQTNSDSDAFKKYTELCARDAISRFSVDTLEGDHINNVSNTQYLLQTGDSNRAGPSVSNQRKRARQISEIIRVSYETDTLKRVCRPAASATSIPGHHPARRPPRVGGIDA
uniref:Uncharacterized protein n=1 Tax=Tanacetum cinerariifolium TaxID=118510 RepID=A0A699INV4_TANCI|nr:hypothetical protein [Tanacetum cinerariifolium]